MVENNGVCFMINLADDRRAPGWWTKAINKEKDFIKIWMYDISKITRNHEEYEEDGKKWEMVMYNCYVSNKMVGADAEYKYILSHIGVLFDTRCHDEDEGTDECKNPSSVTFTINQYSKKTNRKLFDRIFAFKINTCPIFGYGYE